LITSNPLYCVTELTSADDELPVMDDELSVINDELSVMDAERSFMSHRLWTAVYERL